MTKFILAAVAALSICLGARAASTHDKVQLWEGGPYWATTNIGAENPEDYGYYFWWGDTVGYTNTGSAWISVKDGTEILFESSSPAGATYNKNNSALQSAGYIDSAGNLVAAYDAATAHLGSPWRMPTRDEIDALISNCTTTWITTNGVNGRLVTGKDDYADRSIFLPGAGYGTGHGSDGSNGSYWSSTPDSSDSRDAFDLYVTTNEFRVGYGGRRFYGQSVRPVWQPVTVDLSTLTANYTARDGDVLTGSTAYGVIIPDGATVTLAGVNVVPSSGPAISCAGDATILLADRTANVATGNPGVRLPDVSSKTLTITVPEGGDGSGALTATGNWGGAGIGNTYDASDKGNLCIGGGNITATGGSGSAGIGSGSGSGNTYAKVGTITISGGMVTATGSYNCSAIGRSASGRCGDVTIGSDVQKIVASNSGSAAIISSYSGSVTIASSLKQTYSNNDRTLTIEPDCKYAITWLNDDGTEIDTTIVPSNAVPVHADPTKAAEAPYRWVFTGWSPELEAAVSNTTYTATFQKIADLALATNNWTAANGDVLTGDTANNINIPGGASVTINGVTVTGIGGGAANPPPAFASGGKAATTEFVQAEGGKWTLTTFAELANDALGADVAAEQIKVYAADTVEGLESASPMTSGVTVTEKKSAVKTTIEVTPSDSTAAQQFFKVKFGE